MKITKYKDKIRFKGKYCKGLFYYDGSGFLEVKSPEYIHENDYYCREDYIHSDRVKDIKKLANLYTKAYKELCKIPKIKFKRKNNEN